ncbi:hypothetical protein Cgig2_009946 [Carnegiea gigantea]|uniref:Uncharacterized protein n=1 Tax=Carnegiea gigantea TaxID=171969 RepID=A0A9Q1GWH5_9CARY|nr:hypothetical protein Cgig2_009946 [Carnegiea gigantea]
MELSFKSRMKTAKSHGLVMCTLKNIYILKDAIVDEVPNPCFESNDPRTNLWEELPRPLVVQKYSAEGYAVVDDRFIIISSAPLGWRKLPSGDFYAYDTKMQSWSCVKKVSSDIYYDRFDGKAECVDRNISVILGGSVIAFRNESTLPLQSLCSGIDVEKLDTAQLRLQDIVSTSNRALGTAWTMHRLS